MKHLSRKHFLIFFLYSAASSGVFIENLEEEDYYLLQKDTRNETDEDDNDFIYHERMQPDFLKEVWDVTDEDVNADFPQGQSRLPSVDVFSLTSSSRVHENAKVIVRWMLIFLCLWSSFCSLSDNAFEILLVFLRAVFDCMGTIFPLVASYSFERYNGILVDFGTNQRSVEMQLMRKFTSNQFMKDIPLPTVFQEIFQPLLTRLASKHSGTLKDHISFEHESMCSQVIQASVLSIGRLQKGGQWANTDSLYTIAMDHLLWII